MLLVHTEEAVVRSRFRPVWQRTLVRAQVLDAVTRSESAVLALRRQTTGPGGRLFPALDADLWLPPPGEHSARLSLAGVHRPPLGARGASLDRVDLSAARLRRTKLDLAGAVLLAELHGADVDVALPDH